MTLPKRKPTKGVYGTRKADGPLRSPGHLAFVRSHECCVPGCKDRPIEVAHISSNLPVGANKGGTGEKCGDDWTISLCVYHHRLGTHAIHNMGEGPFSRHHGIDVWKLAREFAAASPALRRLKARQSQG